MAEDAQFTCSTRFAEVAKAAGCADELPRIVGDETWPQPP
jgi:hypothetical protein